MPRKRSWGCLQALARSGLGWRRIAKKRPGRQKFDISGARCAGPAKEFNLFTGFRIRFSGPTGDGIPLLRPNSGASAALRRSYAWSIHLEDRPQATEPLTRAFRAVTC